MTNKRVTVQILKLLFVCFVFCTLHVKRFASKCTELKVDLLYLQALEKILFTGMCLLFSAVNFTGLGSEEVNSDT